MPTETQDLDFTLTSPAFVEGGSIPREFTCDADDTSPPLEWTGLPDASAALALIVDDPDAGGFVHWVAYDIDPALGGLASGASTAPALHPRGGTGFGQTGYGGPCPPSGTHDYVFRLLALGRALGLSGAPGASEVLAAAEAHILDEAQLTGTYRRGG
jgi:Raf kinase inhibitor-like YbhB/YbcL family protein